MVSSAAKAFIAEVAPSQLEAVRLRTTRPTVEQSSG